MPASWPSVSPPCSGNALPSRSNRSSRFVTDHKEAHHDRLSSSSCFANSMPGYVTALPTATALAEGPPLVAHRARGEHDHVATWTWNGEAALGFAQATRCGNPARAGTPALPDGHPGLHQGHLCGAGPADLCRVVATASPSSGSSPAPWSPLCSPPAQLPPVSAGKTMPVEFLPSAASAPMPIGGTTEPPGYPGPSHARGFQWCRRLAGDRYRESCSWHRQRRVGTHPCRHDWSGRARDHRRPLVDTVDCAALQHPGYPGTGPPRR